MKLGIVGLPNVGKSTLFNALTSTQNAQAANYPFCTIEPNSGIVPVPDPRLDKLAEIWHDAQCGEADPAARAALRTKANEELAAMVRAETTDALNKVLFELSSGMKNAYSRSDA